ncbi:MAG: Lsr2 family protein [Arachnia sp.]
MAKKVHVQLIDDIDESVAERTVTFALDGASYEIDLSADNIAKLQAALAPFVDNAQAQSSRVRGRKAAARGAGRADASLVRAWAREQGMEVSDRGRVPNEVLEAYRNAH